MALSAVINAVVSALVARRVRDANTPFRLVRRGLLEDVRPLLGGAPLAPSILVTVAGVVRGWRVVEVLVVHPRRPLYGTTFSIPRSLNTLDRDADLESIRERIDGLDDLDAALVVGDLNAAPSEPARAAFQAGLTDAHLAVGGGPGFTWRPEPLETLKQMLLILSGIAIIAGVHIALEP